MVTPGRRFCGSGGEELLSDGPAKAASWSGGGCFWARKVGFSRSGQRSPCRPVAFWIEACTQGWLRALTRRCKPGEGRKGCGVCRKGEDPLTRMTLEPDRQGDDFLDDGFHPSPLGRGRGGASGPSKVS